MGSNPTPSATRLGVNLQWVYPDDDLAFSGSRNLARTATTLVRTVSHIARDEGFRVNITKTRVRSQGQRQSLGGMVINDHPNLNRVEYERLKATLHQAARHGPETVNRERQTDLRSHLLGRIAWVESINPHRGAKLRQRFEQITW